MAASPSLSAVEFESKGSSLHRVPEGPHTASEHSRQWCAASTPDHEETRQDTLPPSAKLSLLSDTYGRDNL